MAINPQFSKLTVETIPFKSVKTNVMPFLIVLAIAVVLYVVFIPILSNKPVPMEETDAFFKAMQSDYDELKIS